ncbi:MAG: ribonuclease III [Oscillospiraceae bacterium]|nr:ribonuclease III [Oscillospiraceae bacterium]
MQDFLHSTLSKEEIFEMSATALAHIGDAAFELMVRSNLCKRGIRKAGELHKSTVMSVSAKAQKEAAEKILSHLTDEENAVFLRGRNAKVNTIPKHSDPATYHTATAFEALWGYLFLLGRYDRLNALFQIIIDK